MLVATLANGCGDASPGTIAGLPPRIGPLGYAPSATLTVHLPEDVRPVEEHEGASAGMHFFFTVIALTHWEHRGNYVTDDLAATANAPAELHAGMIESLRAANVARDVVPEGATDFVLETLIEHLYATHYAVSEGTVLAFSVSDNRGNGMSNVDVVAGDRQFACYGNVTLNVRLVDRRGPAPAVVWEEHVTGFGEEAPGDDDVLASRTALREAVSDALGTLSIRVGTALDRLQRGPSGPGHVIGAGFPPVFVVERVSRYRSFLERVYLETASGRVLRHEIIPTADPSMGRPGDWLLSRRSPEGVMLSPEAYEQYGKSLAERYELRTVDDAYRYHFFGRR